MTVTIKLDVALEEQLRQRAVASGRSTSDVVRAALQLYLAQADDGTARSAFELGAGLFGQHAGPVDLAQQRKAAFATEATSRHALRQAGRS